MVLDAVTWHAQPIAVVQHKIAAWFMFSKQHLAPVAHATASNDKCNMFGPCRSDLAQHVTSAVFSAFATDRVSLGIDYTHLVLIKHVWH